VTTLTCCLLLFAAGDGSFENWESTTVAESTLPDSVATRIDSAGLVEL